MWMMYRRSAFFSSMPAYCIIAANNAIYAPDVSLCRVSIGLNSLSTVELKSSRISPQSSELGCFFTYLYFFCIFCQSSSIKRTGSIWPSCIHFLGINGRRGEEDWVPFTFAFFHSQKSNSQGSRPPFSNPASGHFFPQGEGHPFLRGIGIHVRQTWGGFGSEMENEKVAKKKTADILLKLFEWKQERSNMANMDETHETHYINCTGQPRYLCLLLRA